MPPSWITPEEANDRYQDIFEALLDLPTVYELRRSCLALEARDRFWAAGQLFLALSRHLGDEEIEWFRLDLEAATSGRYTIVDGRYEEAAVDEGKVTSHTAEPVGSSARRGATRLRRAGVRLARRRR